MMFPIVGFPFGYREIQVAAARRSPASRTIFVLNLSTFPLRKLLKSSSNLLMENRFDPAKDAANRAKHNLPLLFGDEIFKDENHVVISSIREIDGEERFKVIGRVGEKLFTGVYVWRNNQTRFISVRRSNRSEEREYEQG